MIFGFYMSLLPLLVFLYIFAPKEMSSTYIAWVLILLAACFLLFYSRKEKNDDLRGQLLKHSNMALFGYVVVHFQYYIDFVLGNVPADNLFVWVNYSVVIKCLLLSTIGVVCFFIGYLLCAKIKVLDKVPPIERACGTHGLKFIALILLLVYFYTVDSGYLFGGYGIVEMGGSAKYASLAFNAAIFSILIQEYRNVTLCQKNVVGIFHFVVLPGYTTLAMVMAYLATVVLSGDRGPLIAYTLCYLAGYLSITKKKINWVGIIVAVFVASSTLTLLGVARSLGDESGFSQKIQMAYQKRIYSDESSFLPPTQELAGSVNALHHAVSYVPDQHDFLYGRFQAQQLLYAIPFSSRLILLVTEEGTRKYLDVSEFITWIAQGDNPTYGSGSSVVADFYIAFGVLGVAIGMFSFGWLMRASEQKMYSQHLSSVFWHVIWVVYFCNSIYIARSSLLESFKLVLMVAFLLYLNGFIFKKRSSIA